MSPNGSNIISYDGTRSTSARDGRYAAGVGSSRVSYRSSSAYGASSHAVGEVRAARGLGFDEELSPLRNDPFASRQRSGFSKVSRSGRITPVESFNYDSGQAKQAASSRVSTRSASRRSAGAGFNFSAFSAFDDLDAQLNGATSRSSASFSEDAYGSVNASSQPRAAVETFDPEDEQAENRKTKKQRQKKQRAKAKADKMFNRQFAGQGSAEGQGQGSRAAVYKGEMGKSHKRAFSDLGGFAGRGSQANSKTKGNTNSSVLGSALRWRFAPLIIGVLGCAVVAAVTVVWLFPTAQQCYISSREYDKMQAEYELVSQRNAAIQSEVDYLSTDAGIADAAREQLGWVAEGETAGVVTGLSQDDSSDSEKVYARVDTESVKAPTTWYSEFLDPIFGYEG